MVPAGAPTAEREQTNSETATPKSGTERIAAQLEQDGFDVTHQRGAIGPANDIPGNVAFIEVDVTYEDREQVEQYVSEADTAVPHRVIGPGDTQALPDWPSDSPCRAGSETRSMIIVPCVNRGYSAEEKAEHRASSL